MINPLLSPAQKKLVVDLLHRNNDVFGISYQHLTQTNLVEFHVNTAGNAAPIYHRPYPFLSYSEKELLKKEISKMVENGILILTTYTFSNSKKSGWSFPCRYVLKNGGQDKRLITQFMKLSDAIVRDMWPLSNITGLLEEIKGANWISALDLLKDFHQIKVHKGSVHKFTIATSFGNYSYLAVPFGVINGPIEFSCIHFAMKPLIGEGTAAC